MRLFVAINFSDEVKDGLCAVINELQSLSQRGSFTRRENLHLTLAFLGESAKLSAIEHAMDAVTAEPFELTVGGFGRFRRNGGDIYWVGVEKSTSIQRLHRLLWDELSKIGFQPEDRPFQPHLTLGREIMVNSDFQAKEFEKKVIPMHMNIGKISLMKSERIQGRLTYTELYERKLDGVRNLQS